MTHSYERRRVSLSINKRNCSSVGKLNLLETRSFVSVLSLIKGTFDIQFVC